jgi:hypothetical protein
VLGGRRAAGETRSPDADPCAVDRIEGFQVLAARARRVTDGMFDAAAHALGELSPAASDLHASLLPRVAQLRAVATHIASAVVIAAVNGGVAPAASDDELRHRIGTAQWTPHYEISHKPRTKFPNMTGKDTSEQGKAAALFAQGWTICPAGRHAVAPQADARSGRFGLAGRGPGGDRND